MASPSNLAFGTAGMNPGDADAWTRTAVSSAADCGQYDGRRAEAFVNWPAGCAAAYRFAGFDPGDLTRGLYADNLGAYDLPAETFIGWGGDLSKYRSAGFESAEPGLYDSGANPFEAFTGWGTTGYFIGPNVVSTNVTRGLYDSGANAYEGFLLWFAGSYFTGPNVLNTNTIQGLYDGAVDGAEPFVSCFPGEWEGLSWPSTTISVAPDAGEPVPPVGTPLIFSVVGVGTLPAEVDATSVFWVVYSVGATIKVSATKGGSAISFAGGSGSGVWAYAAHPDYAWPQSYQ